MTARFPWKIFTRVVLIQALLVLTAIAGSAYAARVFFKDQFIAQTRSQLKDTLQLLRAALPGAEIPGTWCQQYGDPTGYRMMVSRQDGGLICQSRPEVGGEIQAALAWPERGLLLQASRPLAQLNHSLALLDTAIAIFILVIAAGLGGIAIWSGRMLFFPMGRLLVKAQSVLQLHQEGGGTPPASGLDSELLTEEGLDEWSEIETSIDEIRQDSHGQSRKPECRTRGVSNSHGRHFGCHPCRGCRGQAVVF